MPRRRFSLREILVRWQGEGAGLDRLMALASAQAFLIQGIGALLAFAMQWTLARLLGVESFGIYVYCMTWLRMFILPATFGLDNSTVRFTSAYAAQEEWGLLRGFLTRSKQIVLATSVGLTAITVASIWAFRGRLEQEMLYGLLVTAVTLPFFAFRLVTGGSLRAFQRFVFALTARDIAPPLLVIAGVLVVWLARGDLTAPLALTVHLLANAVILAVIGWALRGATPPPASAAVAEHRTREWMFVSLPMLLLSSFFLLLKQTDILMVGTLMGPAPAGIYAVASRFAMLISFGLKSVNAIMAPLISQLHATGRMPELQRLVSRSARMIFVFTVTACAALFLGGEWALGLFGDEFRAGNDVLRLLLLSQAVNALAGSVGHLLTMTGSQRLAAWIAGSGALVNVVLNIVLIPLWGIVGAAVATAVSTVGWNVAAVIAVRRRLGVNPIVSWSR